MIETMNYTFWIVFPLAILIPIGLIGLRKKNKGFDKWKQ